MTLTGAAERPWWPTRAAKRHVIDAAVTATRRWRSRRSTRWASPPAGWVPSQPGAQGKTERLPSRARGAPGAALLRRASVERMLAPLEGTRAGGGNGALGLQAAEVVKDALRAPWAPQLPAPTQRRVRDEPEALTRRSETTRRPTCDARHAIPGSADPSVAT